MVSMARLLSVASVAAPPLPRTLALPTSIQAVARWPVRHRALLWPALLLLVAALIHGVNMFNFPYYEDDEGTYMSQAWAVLHSGQLAPYTYWYDHAPGGWLQISVWALLTGGFHTFGGSGESGRVFMLVLQLASTGLLYGIARRISGSTAAATVAALLFALSAYGVYFHRRVLLDNITTPWMLLSIFMLLSPRLTLPKIWLSAAALGISILSKEVTAFLIPAMAYLVFYRAHRSQRAFATIGWLTLLLSMLSLYVLMAILKGELFPQGTMLGGQAPHVSLLGSLQYQSARGGDNGPLNPHSAFWQVTSAWMRDEPLLVIGGTLCAFISVLLIRRHRLVGVMGLLSLSLWAFIARGGVVFGFYLIPLLPLLALNIALLLGLLLGAPRPGAGAEVPFRRRAARAAALVLAAAYVIGIAGGYFTPNRGFASDHLQLWTSTQANAQDLAIAWVQAHVPASDRIIMDNYAYTDLHDGSAAGKVYTRADYYWKLDRDPAIGGTIYHYDRRDFWRNVDYVITTIQLYADTRETPLQYTNAILQHSVPVVHFDTGGWPVEVRQVIKPGSPVQQSALPTATQFSFAEGESTTTTHSMLTLANPGARAVRVTITFYSPIGDLDTMVVYVDSYSQQQIDLATIDPMSGTFGVGVHAGSPISGYLSIRRDGTAGDSLLVSKRLARRWLLRESYSPGITGDEALAVLNPDRTATAHLTLDLQGIDPAQRSTRGMAIRPHSVALIPLSPDDAPTITIRSDLPIAADRTVQFSPAGYRLAAPAGGQAVSGWLSAQSSEGNQSQTFLTLYNPACSAAFAGQVATTGKVASPAVHQGLEAAWCQAPSAQRRFLQVAGVHDVLSAGTPATARVVATRTPAPPGPPALRAAGADSPPAPRRRQGR